MSTLIRINKSGPYLVSGPLELFDPQGNTVMVPEGKTIALCRCGHSANKPYCDGSHGRMGFVAEDSAKQP